MYKFYIKIKDIRKPFETIIEDLSQIEYFYKLIKNSDKIVEFGNICFNINNFICCWYKEVKICQKKK